MNRIRSDLPYWVPPQFQAFDHGKIVECPIPESWRLRPGDILNWELSHFYGFAEVVSVGQDVVSAFEIDDRELDDEITEVPGRLCTFKKLS